jgi:hypothetical protein
MNSTQYVFDYDAAGKMNFVQTKEVHVEVYGKINYINAKNKKIFKIYAETLNRTYRCYCDFNCQIQMGDAIFGRCKYEPNTRYGEQLTFLSKPYVQIASDKESILHCFLKALNSGPNETYRFYERLIEKNGTLEQSLKLLDRMSLHWYNYKDEDVYLPYLTVLSDIQIKMLLKWWYHNRVIRRLNLFGFSNKEIQDFEISPNTLYEKIVENPYTVFEIPMARCEELLTLMGRQDILNNPDEKCCAEMVRKVYSYMKERGWSGIPTNIFLSLYPDAPKYIETLKERYGIVAEMRTVYLSYVYEIESEIIKMIQRYLSSALMKYEISPDNVSYTRDNLSCDQKAAIIGALTQNICIINGSAGTGKTTIIKEIIHNLEIRGIKYKVVSFTGKAVARLKEVLNTKAPSTMHRCIANVKSGKDKKMVKYATDSGFDHLIIDEVSMVTTELFYEFRKIFSFDYKITLVGDMNQLTPISWGSLFDQLVKSQCIPTYSLKQVHRTKSGAENGILINANAIITYYDDDDAPPFDFVITKNFNMIPGDEKIIDLLVSGLKNVGIIQSQIVIICPYNTKINDLNRICQRIFNGENRHVQDAWGTIWKFKDRVMLTQNNEKINIMNREEGMIIDLTDSEIKVAFADGTSHVFKTSIPEPPPLPVQSSNKRLNVLSEATQDMHRMLTNANVDVKKIPKKEKFKKKHEPILTSNMLRHAYAITVDCAQGTEWEYVIYYLPEGSKQTSFLNRNRIYTAITRAKIAIWCVGDLLVMNTSATKHPPYRHDNLHKRIISSQTIKLNNV